MFITTIIFIIILGLLVFVHEFGHFVVARRSGMKVEEFGFGFPPRLVGWHKIKNRWRIIWGHRGSSLSRSTSPSPSPSPGDGEGDETIYSINAIPLGGFVRILGENNEHQENPRSFINRPFKARLVTLVAGVAMNLLLAWVLLTVGFSLGLPTAINDYSELPKHSAFYNPQIAVIEVVKNLPADMSGIKTGDIILEVDGKKYIQIESMRNYILSKAGEEINFSVDRAGETLSLKVKSDKVPKPGEGPTGIALALVGKMRFPWYLSIWEGLKTTGVQIAVIGNGLYRLVTGQLNLDNLGGPVKIAQLTGAASRMGFDYLLQFTAFLSLNLAILNILPFPALDGGRVLFLIIEKIRRKRNNQKIEQIVNTAGFVFLILLMILVTIKDIRGA